MTYDVTNFLEKNRDTLFRDVVMLCAEGSARPFVRALFRADAARTSQTPRRIPTTAVEDFRGSVEQLMAAIAPCSSPHYVRCIKPNAARRPFEFDARRVAHQARRRAFSIYFLFKKI